MKPDVNRVVRDIAEVFQFEYWIRFYFLEEKDEGKLFVNIPEEVARTCADRHHHLAGLIPLLDKAEVDYSKSLATVSEYLAARLDGDKYEPHVVGQTLDCKAFKVEMYLFNLWIKGHEEILDEETRSFADWMEMYQGWKGQDEVQAYILKLHASGSGAEVRTDTVQ